MKYTRICVSIKKIIRNCGINQSEVARQHRREFYSSFRENNFSYKTDNKTEIVNKSRKTNMNLSFAGCGFLGIYHVGVAVCFKKYAPHLLLDKISGASVGCLAAAGLLCDMPLGKFSIFLFCTLIYYLKQQTVNFAFC